MGPQARVGPARSKTLPPVLLFLPSPSPSYPLLFRVQVSEAEWVAMKKLGGLAEGSLPGIMAAAAAGSSPLTAAPALPIVAASPAAAPLPVAPAVVAGGTTAADAAAIDTAVEEEKLTEATTAAAEPLAAASSPGTASMMEVQAAG